MSIDEIINALSLSLNKPVWRIRQAPSHGHSMQRNEIEGILKDRNM
jgi:hypothetical protein